jgi:hypothetical protein
MSWQRGHSISYSIGKFSLTGWDGIISFFSSREPNIILPLLAVSYRLVNQIQIQVENYILCI